MKPIFANCSMKVYMRLEEPEKTLEIFKKMAEKSLIKDKIDSIKQQQIKNNINRF
jgi:pentatricopeptide repeat protein